MAQSQTVRGGTADTEHRIELSGVADGRLKVTEQRVRTFVDGSQSVDIVSDRLGVEFLALFDGGTIDVASLTAEERAWISAEADRIDLEARR